MPGAVYTEADGINSAGTITGIYDDANGGTHGYLLQSGTFTTVDAPGSTGATDTWGINKHGDVVGDFADASSVHGFVAKGLAKKKPKG